ncbi:MAG: GNAT family N-acetyltransferase, partial [Burkholderiales bacterium]
FFLTWEWLHTWWQHMRTDRDLHIVTVREGDRLVALAPLVLRPARWQRLVPFPVLEFLGCGNVGSDYLSVLVRGGNEEAALGTLARYLTDKGLALELSHVNRQSAPMHATARQLRELGWHEHQATIECCPYIALEGHTWESYVNALGRTHRTNFKRKVKKLNQLYRLRIEEASTHDERRAALDVLVNLHLKRRREVGGSDALHTRALQDFHEELTRVALDAGWLRLQVMWLDDAPVAAMYGFEYAGVFYFYQSGFDSAYATYSVGLVMAGLAIKSAIERGVREFDFLHGNEGYKYLWASAERELLRFHLFPPGARGACLSQLMHKRRQVMRLLKPAKGSAEGPRLTDRSVPAAATTSDEASEDVT